MEIDMRLLALLSLLFVPTFAVASSERYISLEISQTDVDWDGFSIVSGGKLDNSSDGFAITYGHYLDDNLALELSYVDGGSFTLNQSTGDTFLLDGVEYVWLEDVFLDIEASAMSASLKYDFVDEANYEIYGRFGFFDGDKDYSGALNGSDGLSGNVMGVGLFYHLEGDASLKVEYSKMSDDDELTSLSFGLVYGF